MTLQNNSLNSLLKDNSRALKPYIIFKTCVCFNQKHPRSQRFTLHFSFCLFSKCTVMVYLLYCTEALIPQSPPFCISETRWFSHCHSTNQWEDFCFWQNLMVVNGLLEWKRKVGTKRSWLDIMSWLDMHWYRGGKRDESYLAMSLEEVLVLGRICGYKNKLLFWASCLDIS